MSSEDDVSNEGNESAQGIYQDLMLEATSAIGHHTELSIKEQAELHRELSDAVAECLHESSVIGDGQ